MLIFDDGENCYLESNYLEDIHDDQEKKQKFDLFLKGFNVGYLNFEVAVKMNMTGQ